MFFRFYDNDMNAHTFFSLKFLEVVLPISIILFELEYNHIFYQQCCCSLFYFSTSGIGKKGFMKDVSIKNR